MKYTARQPVSNVNVTKTSPVKEFFVLGGGLLAVVVGIYLLLGFFVDFIVPYVSPDLERAMALPYIRSIESGEENNTEASRYMQSLVDCLRESVSQDSYDFTVHVRDAQVINAVALPGGHIVIYTGLLNKVSSENELSFVLAHEMGHYANRDHLRGLGRALVFMTMSTLLLGPDSSVSAMLAQSLGLTELSFSRKQEYRADAFAVRALIRVYGHAAGAVDFFEKISKEHDPGVFGHYFASHPENRRRINRIKEIIHTEGSICGDYKNLPDTIKKSSN